MRVPLADRLNHVEEYFFSRKLREVAKLNTDGIEVINLGPGGPDLPPSGVTRATLARYVQEPHCHGYQPYNGTPQLRKAMAEWYKQTYSVDLNYESEVLPLLGSKEGIFFISLAFLNPGDEVLVPDPGYPSYAAVARLVGAVPVTYDLRATEDRSIDLEGLAKRDLSRVKVMWANFPHMPTGATQDLTGLAQLVDFARKHNILLCHDNPYSLILNTSAPLSIHRVEDAIDCAIELNSLSKSHHMAGWRIGMAVGHKDYLKALLAVQSNMASGEFLPLQLAAIEALKNTKQWHAEQNTVYRERRRKICELMDLIDCTYESVRPGLFVWAKVPDRVTDVFQFLDDLLYGAHIFLTPGAIFGRNGSRYIRASLCVKSEQIELAIERVRDYLKSTGSNR